MDIDEGVTSITRVGKKITLRSLQAYIRLAPVSATGVAGQTIVVSLVCDKQGGSAPVLTDIWNQSYASIRNADGGNMSRYTVLKSWKTTFPEASTELQAGMKTYHIFMRFPKDSVVRYDTTDGESTSANNMWLCFQTTNSATTSSRTMVSTQMVNYEYDSMMLKFIVPINCGVMFYICAILARLPY